jgi:hypothetical protein
VTSEREYGTYTYNDKSPSPDDTYWHAVNLHPSHDGTGSESDKESKQA